MEIKPVRLELKNRIAPVRLTISNKAAPVYIIVSRFMKVASEYPAHTDVFTSSVNGVPLFLIGANGATLDGSAADAKLAFRLPLLHTDIFAQEAHGFMYLLGAAAHHVWQSDELAAQLAQMAAAEHADITAGSVGASMILEAKTKAASVEGAFLDAMLIGDGSLLYTDYFAAGVHEFQTMPLKLTHSDITDASLDGRLDVVRLSIKHEDIMRKSVAASMLMAEAIASRTAEHAAVDTTLAWNLTTGHADATAAKLNDTLLIAIHPVSSDVTFASAKEEQELKFAEHIDIFAADVFAKAVRPRPLKGWADLTLREMCGMTLTDILYAEVG